MMSGVILDACEAGNAMPKHALDSCRSPFQHFLCIVTVFVVFVSSGCHSLNSLPTLRGQTPEPQTAWPVEESPSSGSPLDEPILDVLIEGNRVHEDSVVMQHIKTQRGRITTERMIREDLRRLYNTHWFFSVEPVYRRTNDGLILVFRVVERPTVERVEYRGNKNVKTKKLEKATELKPGDALDISQNRQLVQRLEEEYRKWGYPDAKVKLVKGGDKDDHEVVFEIDEGQQLAVTHVKFTGNESRYAFDRLLATKLRTKKALPGGITLLGGKYDPATIADDIESLKQYYHDLGHFDVSIKHRVAVSDVRFNPFRRGDGNVTIEYQIEEGPRYRIGDVQFEGNTLFSDAELRNDLKLTKGEYFSSRLLNGDVEGIKGRYDERGRLFAAVDAVPRFLEEPGVVDLVYQMDEDRVYTIRKINVHIQGDYPHTQESVVLNRILTNPGDLASAKEIRRSERRLEGTIFERGPGAGPRVQVSKVPDEEPSFSERVATRGQSDPLPLPQPSNPIFENNPYGDPFGRALSEPPGQVDLDYYVTEARTGRLMFGAGVNSDAGVVGSVILEENNFDILRPPTSFQDIMNGTAWRGKGQRFRIEAVPGDIVSRYLVSFSDPYFLNTDYSFGISGFYFNRFYPDWDEDRLGGRVSLGYQFNKEWSISGATRLESVELSNPRVPTPPILQESIRTNTFYSERVSLSHDTRDAPFLPGEGHFIQASYEQAFGDYVYPRIEAEARQYFTVYSRPDGSGRQILSLRGEFGWTDVDTPIFERFYAGGFQSMRGFEYRGVGPIGAGTSVRVGGRWLFLGGAEYTFPLTADEVISGVVFTDFGTIDEAPELDDIRVTVGAGLRLTIPAMGPAPIALDWGIPVRSVETDDEQVFSFYIGIFR